jgi:hypothetical protein
MRRFRRGRSRRQEWDDETDETTSSVLDAIPEDLYDEYDDFEEAAIEPFVPVDGGYSENGYGPGTAYPARERRRRVRLPRPHLTVHLPNFGLRIRWDYLLLALFMIVGGVFGALLNRGQVQEPIKAWWPLAIVVVAGLWMIIALARRQVASFLGGAALAGVGLSLVMNNQDIADFKETVLGMVLVTAGLGIVIRGFVLRQRTPLP